MRIVYKKLSNSEKKWLLIFCLYFRNCITDKIVDGTIKNRDAGEKASRKLHNIIYNLLAYFSDDEGCDIVWNCTRFYIDNRDKIELCDIVSRLKSDLIESTGMNFDDVCLNK